LIYSDREVNDVDRIFLFENKVAHLRVPALGLVPVVNSRFEEFSHGFYVLIMFGFFWHDEAIFELASSFFGFWLSANDVGELNDFGCAVDGKSGARGDEVTHDDVFFESAETIHFS